MHRSQRMLVGNQRRIHAGRHSGLAILHHGQQLDDLVFGGRGGNIVGGDLGDASTDTSSMVTLVWKPSVA